MFGILETLFLAHVINETSSEQKQAQTRHDAEQAVIEAAKAHKHGWHNGHDMYALTVSLHKATEALQEVEGE